VRSLAVSKTARSNTDAIILVPVLEPHSLARASETSVPRVGRSQPAMMVVAQESLFTHGCKIRQFLCLRVDGRLRPYSMALTLFVILPYGFLMLVVQKFYIAEY
jgi:hypothetical protein